MAAPNTPTLLKVNISLKEADLTWEQDGDDITDFEVRYQAEDDTAFGAWQSTQSTDTQHTVRRLKIGQEYTFEVRATNADGPSDASDAVSDQQHRRGQIIDAFTANFDALRDTADNTDYPFKAKTIRKTWTDHVTLSRQNAVPALLITAEDGGSAPDAPSVGYIDEYYPIGLWVVLEETDDKNLTDQYSDAHYSVGSVINANRRLVPHVEDVRIRDWRVQPIERTYPNLVAKFRVFVKHRYHSKENV